MAKICPECQEPNPDNAATCLYCGLVFAMAGKPQAPAPPRGVRIEDPLAELLRRTFAGRFDIEREVALSTGKAVYAAIDVRRGRRVALKVYLPRSRKEAQRIGTLVETAKQYMHLEHPGIARLLGTGSDGRVIYAVSEWAEGVDAETQLIDVGALAPLRVARIGVGVAESLAAMHAAGLHHGNVKPSNIMLGPDPADRPVLLDAGLNRLELSGSDVIYAAPEIFRGGAPGPAADQFALGVALFELLTGRLPFVMKRDEDGETLLRSRPLSKEIAQLPSQFPALITRLLAPDPAARFPEMSAVVRALRELAQRRGELGRGPDPATAFIPGGRRTRPLLTLGLRALIDGRPQLARRHLQLAQSLDPKSAEAAALLAEAERAEASRREAEARLRRALERFSAGDHAGCESLLVEAEELLLGHPPVLALRLLAADAAREAEQAPEPAPAPRRAPSRKRPAPPPSPSPTAEAPPPAGLEAPERPPRSWLKVFLLVSLPFLLIIGAVGAYLLLQEEGPSPPERRVARTRVERPTPTIRVVEPTLPPLYTATPLPPPATATPEAPVKIAITATPTELPPLPSATPVSDIWVSFELASEGTFTVYFDDRPIATLQKGGRGTTSTWTLRGVRPGDHLARFVDEDTGEEYLYCLRDLQGEQRLYRLIWRSPDEEKKQGGAPPAQPGPSEQGE